MLTLSEIRKNYPEYNDMSDSDLASRFYKKNYPNMPKTEFNQKFGLKESSINEKVEAKQPIPASNEMDRQNPIVANSLSPELKGAYKGFNQGVENTGIGLADLLPGVNIKRANWAPDTRASNIGEYAADVGSYFVPGIGVNKAINSIPKIAEAVKSISSAYKDRPALNALANIAKEGAKGGLFGAIQNPEDQAGGAAMGAGLGAATGGLSGLLKSDNPFVKAISRAALGAGAGYGVGTMTPYGGTKGAEIGAGLGLAAPSVLNSLGLGKDALKPGQNTLLHIKPEDVQESVAAGERLGTRISPAEASNNPYVANLEADFARTPKAAAERTNIKIGRSKDEENAIYNFLNKVYDKSVASDNKIRDLYSKSYESNIDNALLRDLKEDPVISEAFRQVKIVPAYRKNLKDIPENNFQYLDRVNSALHDMEDNAMKNGSTTEAGIITNTRNDMVNILDSIEPKYAEARAEAQKKIVRKQIEDSMNSKKLRGSDFYNTVLKNNMKYKKLLYDLKNVPEAQSMLKDMKSAWGNLINLESARGGYAKSETSMSKNREPIQKIIDYWHELTGEEKNVNAIKYLNSPEWIKDVESINKIKDKQTRAAKYADLLGKLTTASATPKGRVTDIDKSNDWDANQ